MGEATRGLGATIGFDTIGGNLWRTSPLRNLIASRTVTFMTGSTLGHFNVLSVFLTPEGPDRTGFF